MDIVIVTFNRWEYLRRCLASLLDTTPETDRVIVVDNCSFDFTPKYLEMMRIKYPQRRLTVYRPKVNVGCAGGRNWGFDISEKTGGREQEFIAMFDDDYSMRYDWRPLCMEALKSEDNIGLATAHDDQCGGDKRIEEKQIRPGLTWFYKRNITTSAAIIRRDAYRQVGGYRKSNKVLGWISTDFCERLAANGWRIISIRTFGGPAAENMDYKGSRFYRGDLYKQTGYVDFRKDAKAGQIDIGDDVTERFKFEIEEV